MKQNINPIGLKGNEINERMKALMGIAPINENRRSSVVELTKTGPDGNVYGIVRENHEYYIKIAKKTTNLVSEDFSYIGGLMNKKQAAYPTYAKALKQLNIKFNSLNEAYGKSGQVNVFENDDLMEDDEISQNPEEVESVTETEVEANDDIELTEIEQQVVDMVDETSDIESVKAPVVKENKLSIERAIEKMDSIIASIEGEDKKKVYSIR